MTEPTLALCHEWLTTNGGAEQVARRIVEALGIHDVFTFAARPDLARDLFPGQKIKSSRIGLTSFAQRYWQWLLPLMPSAWRRLDLRPYDVVITSSHACVNSIRVRPDAVQVSYCHTPMRYAWEWKSELARLPIPLRPLWPVAAAWLRRSDLKRSANVDEFVANSRHVAARIRECYGRDASVVYPPVDIDYWTPDAATTRARFFLFAGRLVAYKRVDIAVRAANLAERPLVVAGGGPELPRLKRMAGGTVRFVEMPSRIELRQLYRQARALVFPGIEDFGMVMVEAQACGTPVIAFNEGGAQEAVIHGQTGILYSDRSHQTLARILGSFDTQRFDVETLRKNVERFGNERFDLAIRSLMQRATAGPLGSHLDHGGTDRE